MEIVEPYARILGFPCDREDGIALLQKVEWCGRISHRSEEAQTGESWERFIKSVVLTHGDWSIVEHASVSVDFLVDRGITHEIVRHRLASYTQESTRFVQYGKKVNLRFTIPQDFDFGSEEAEAWERAMKQAEESYFQILEAGKPPQDARSVLPTCTAARLIMTGNLRNWRHFLLMRTTRETHPQLRQVTIPLLEEFQTRIPLLFDDIEPETRQADNLKKAR